MNALVEEDIKHTSAQLLNNFRNTVAETLGEAATEDGQINWDKFLRYING